MLVCGKWKYTSTSLLCIYWQAIYFHPYTDKKSSQLTSAPERCSLILQFSTVPLFSNATVQSFYPVNRHCSTGTRTSTRIYFALTCRFTNALSIPSFQSALQHSISLTALDTGSASSTHFYMGTKLVAYAYVLLEPCRVSSSLVEVNYACNLSLKRSCNGMLASKSASVNALQKPLLRKPEWVYPPTKLLTKWDAWALHPLTYYHQFYSIFELKFA